MKNPLFKLGPISEKTMGLRTGTYSEADGTTCTTITTPNNGPCA